MTNVTAEMIARGRAGDPAAAPRRGSLAPEVRDAREKLTSSALCQCGFDVELLRLFAKGRRSSGPAMAVLRAVAAAAAATWVAMNAIVIWLALDIAALGMAYRIAGKFLDAEKPCSTPAAGAASSSTQKRSRESHGRRSFGS